jgi:hypothetical protein
MSVRSALAGQHATASSVPVTPFADDLARPPRMSDALWRRYTLVERAGLPAAEVARREGVTTAAVRASLAKARIWVDSWRRRSSQELDPGRR